MFITHNLAQLTQKHPQYSKSLQYMPLELFPYVSDYFLLNSFHYRNSLCCNILENEKCERQIIIKHKYIALIKLVFIIYIECSGFTVSVTNTPFL